MRPKKIVLCVFASENDLSIMSYSLKTKGYRVIGVTDHHQALIELAHENIDLVIVNLKLPCTTVENPIIESMKSVKPHVPILLFRCKADLHYTHPATVVRDRETAVSEILEHIKVLAAKKRGQSQGITGSNGVRSTSTRPLGGYRMIVLVGSLLRGSILPPEPLPPEESERIERLWWNQDHPPKRDRIGYWKTLEDDARWMDRL